jgi:isocitrate lyase
MKAQGIFSEVNDEIGEIIVADINRPRIEELMAPDGTALQKLIRKQA